MSQQRHALLPDEDHAELARERFVQGLKAHIAGRVTPGVPEVYEHRVRPRYEAEHGSSPVDRHQIRGALATDPYYRLWSSLRRSSQHLLWSSVGDAVARQAEDLVDRAREVEAGLGSLRLDPDLVIPWYNAEVDIHVMPGGYRGRVPRRRCGRRRHLRPGSPRLRHGSDGGAQRRLRPVAHRQPPDPPPPRLRPPTDPRHGLHRGPRTLPYVDAFPQAEVHGIDLGAPVLRYAHARAEALGRAVHFSQQNAEATDFPDGHFDLIVSHIVLHEMSPAALRTMLAECRRLLAPGGLMVHADFPGYAGMDPLTQSMIDWDTYNNHEPFWGPMRDMDLSAEAVAAGFEADGVEEVIVPTGRILQTGKARQSGQLWLLVAQR